MEASTWPEVVPEVVPGESWLAFDGLADRVLSSGNFVGSILDDPDSAH